MNRLYRNNCDGTFTDVTAKAGVGGEGYSMAVATADFDNDGLCDIFVAGVNRNILYRNLGGGRFADLTAKAGLSGIDPKRGQDVVHLGGLVRLRQRWLAGSLRLQLCRLGRGQPNRRAALPESRFYCHPKEYAGLPNQLFHNNHDGTFTDVSERSGIARHIGKGMGVAFADFDGDGFTDVFVANDSVRHFLFRNQGDGTFREIGLEAGVALRDDGSAIAGMGVDFRDFDNDGLPDLVVSGMINDGFLLFRNLGKRGLFEDFAQRSGLANGHAASLPAGASGCTISTTTGGGTSSSRSRIFPRSNVTWGAPRHWRTGYFAMWEDGDSKMFPPAPARIFSRRRCTTVRPSPISITTAVSTQW